MASLSISLRHAFADPLDVVLNSDADCSCAVDCIECSPAPSPFPDDAGLDAICAALSPPACSPSCSPCSPCSPRRSLRSMSATLLTRARPTLLCPGRCTGTSAAL
eukprot:1989437-Rhodomonas_salina.1